MDGWMVGWMDGWMDGRTDGRMDGWLIIYLHPTFLPVLKQAIFNSHHSGTLGRMTITQSPRCTPQGPDRRFDALYKKT